MSSAGSALTQKQIASYMLRSSGPELFFSFNPANLSTTVVPRNIQINRPLMGIQFEAKMRVVIATAAYTAIAVEAPQTWLQRLTLRGTHTAFGSQTPFDGSGATLFALPRIFGRRGNTLEISSSTIAASSFSTTQQLNVGQPTRQPELTVPMGLTPGGGAPAANTFGTINTFDLDLKWYLPTYPFAVPDAQALGYLYDPTDWGQTLQLTVQIGDFSSFGTNASGANVTFSAFGSGSGSPQFNILLDYASLGPLRNSVKKALCIRNVQTPQAVLTSAATQTRLQLLQNYKTTSVVSKSGSLLAGSSAGVTVLATLSDTITEQTVLRADNKPLKNLQFDAMTKEFYGFRYETVQPQGYKAISFLDSHNALTLFPGDQLPGGTQLDIAANVVNPSGSAVEEVIQELIVGDVAAAS